MATVLKSKSAATDNTVFVRFVPPSANIRRHHLEDLFSQVGPIKKSSVIVPRAPKSQTEHQDETETESKPPASYGFIKFTSDRDATTAASKLNHVSLRLSATEVIKLRVERASDAASAKSKGGGKNKGKQPQQLQQQQEEISSENADMDEETPQSTVSKANRLILRNLSFYAKESHIRRELESQFGKVAEVHIPQVPSGSGGKHGSTHRGFCFVTFERSQDAKACLQKAESSEIVIQKRAVLVSQALNKTMYENKKSQNHLKPNTKLIKDSRRIDDGEGEDQSNTDEQDRDGDDASGSSSDDSSSGDSDADMGDENDIDDDDDDDREEDEVSRVASRDENAVAERRAIFVRNLPFDATRHDLFELFRQYGYITGIFLVRDRETGIAKGTAFVSFRDQKAVTKALEAARSENDKFVSQREATENQDMERSRGSTELTLKGRQIFINAALDKNTAATLVIEKESDRHSSGKDRRNLYLKGEGRVDNDEENDKTPWDDLPEQDKAKRQRAWSEKNTKLRSPIFFINPTRLSVRNLAKQVDEQELKQLCVDAIITGLKKKLVSAEDIIGHWRASGDISTRDIMTKVEEMGDSIVPPFDSKNVKRHIPSVFIDRDFSGNKKSAGPSRGFGFIEFEHHAHALACLRELNNNTHYSEDFAAGGKHALELRRKRKITKKATENEFIGEDGHVKVPRLIVEFTVENKAKARLQSEHRAQQQANKIKQKIENKHKSLSEKKKEKKKSRGARQRERKRKGLDEPDESKADTAPIQDTRNKVDRKVEPDELPKNTVVKKPKGAKPQKKRRVDKEEANFDKLVATYKTNFAEVTTTPAVEDDRPKKSDKRWFED